ncbi:MAG: zinc metallopeptidase [Gemmataceae bacterium]|nr:zinc metallopeptidase [Gemmata sp.]MDW8198641.1 zinc metallopeptidase [Gemmataceae bacterium]
MFFDPMYFLFLAPGILLALWAQARIHSAYHHASRIRAASGYTGAQTAAALLHTAGVTGVHIETVPGQMTDHYSPSEKTLRLSPEVYQGQSLAALGIAAHEAGHAIQDAQRYSPLVIRNLMVPLAMFGSNAAWILLILGFSLQLAGLIYLGIAVFGLTVLFQLVNLPVEFDASRRARQMLLAGGLVTQEEDEEVARVLNAAAMTYVAATLTAVLTLLYFLFRAGAFNRR